MVLKLFLSLFIVDTDALVLGFSPPIYVNLAIGFSSHVTGKPLRVPEPIFVASEHLWVRRMRGAKPLKERFKVDKNSV